MKKLLNYIKESKEELKKVVWPSRKETTQYTILVIATSITVAIFLGFMDYVLTRIISIGL